MLATNDIKIKDTYYLLFKELHDNSIRVVDSA